MTFREIMVALSEMHNSYDAASWLSKPKRALNGRSPGDLLKEGETAEVTLLLEKEPKYKKLYARQSRKK